MGFKAGTTVTVDNALKMLMVKSANDIAVVLAEGVVGLDREIRRRHERGLAPPRHDAVELGQSERSAGRRADHLGARHGDAGARDPANCPNTSCYWHIPAIKFGKRVMRNNNGLIGRYPGADGMKTGFICASGFNVVATATRGGRKLIVVVFGSRSRHGALREGRAAVRERASQRRGFPG